MSKPLIWAIAAALVIMGPLLGIATRRIVDRLAEKTIGKGRAMHRMGFGLAHDLAVPVGALIGLTIALALPTGLPFSPASVHQILTAALMLALTYAVARLCADVVTSVAKRITGVSGSVSLFSTITRVVVFVLGILITLDSVGVQITRYWARWVSARSPSHWPWRARSRISLPEYISWRRKPCNPETSSRSTAGTSAGCAM